MNTTRLSETADHILISRNPMSGRRSSEPRAESLCKLLREKGFHAEVSTDLDYVGRTARDWQATGKLRALVGVGGDGTAAELLNRTEPGTPLTLLAAGNANLLAKLFKLGRSPQRMAEIIAAGRYVNLDVGRANGRFFLVTLGAGFDAEIVRRVHEHRQLQYRQGTKQGGHVTNFSYLKPIMQTIASYRFPPLRVEAFENTGAATQVTRAYANPRWAFAFNMNRYAWGVPLAPGAAADDGRLDACLFSVGSVFAGAIYVTFAQLFGAHRFLPTVRFDQSPRFRFSTLEDGAAIPYQIDGDPGGVITPDSPVDIEVVEKRLTFLVPDC